MEAHCPTPGWRPSHHEAGIPENVATATGGLSFAIHNPDEIRGVFEGIAGDLKHGYLLAFRPAEAKTGEWRKIEVRLTDGTARKVRAREGYYGR